jgi:UDP-glucose 4-epimerase
MATDSGRMRILVTGVGDFLGSGLVRRLETDDRVEHITGLDFREPHLAFRRAEVINADLRSPGLEHLIRGIRPDAILHLQHVRSDREAAGGDGAMHEMNVMGTINLLAVLQRLPFVRKFVLMSALDVYGGGPLDPAVLVEELRPRVPAKTKYAADLIEMESAVSRLGRLGLNIILTCLRFAEIVGPRTGNSISRYLRMSVVPTLMGFDPRLQFCHEEDALAVLSRVTTLDIPGLYNVAGDGVIYLSRALRLGRRMQWPVAAPFMPAMLGALRTVGLTDIQPHQLLLLRYGRAVDTSRLKTRFGFTPRYSTVEAVLDLYGRSTLEVAAGDATETAPEPKVAAA